MLFNSQLFLLAFLPLVLAAYYACGPRRRARQLVVIGASLAFYAAWNWHFLPLLVGLTFANWLVARAYGRSGRRWLLSLGVAANLLVLGIFKYANFLAANVDALIGNEHGPWAIVLPLGISFFVFQKIAYLVDLKRGDRHQYGLIDFFEFVTFFPQLVAGPLVRHYEIIPQFAKPVPAPDTMENLSRGAVLFIIGLTKKAALADTIAVNPDMLFGLAAGGHAIGAAGGWAAAICYSLQIYFDFSGYSDMAIGLALMFGLRLPFNFDAPYRAVSVQDFWRRWHLTLSRFLRDYVYIPLGGNRCSRPRMIGNLMATMLLGGLWHGAAWTFVAWGGWHGAGLAWNHVWQRTGVTLPRLAAWLLTLLFVICGWVLFRSPDFGTAWHVLGAMAGSEGLGHVKLRNAAVVWIAVVIAVVGPTSQEFALRRLTPRTWIAIPAGAALAFLLLLVGGRIPNDFIYFQF
jgi:D-alanyl-lipoteichoic acid acyltransferase DltB (MBOAT superfamily)